MHDYIEKKSLRSFMTRKDSASFGLYKSEEDDSWGTDLTTRIQSPLLVQRSEFASFLSVLERDLKWLEASGGIGFKFIVSSKVETEHEATVLHGVDHSPPSPHGTENIPPFVCMDQDLSQVHTQYLSFLTFPTALAPDKVMVIYSILYIFPKNQPLCSHSFLSLSNLSPLPTHLL